MANNCLLICRDGAFLSAEQVEHYRRDGIVVVDRFRDAASAGDSIFELMTDTGNLKCLSASISESFLFDNHLHDSQK